jgi:hypothetical protein
MNEMNLYVSSEYADELTASYSESMSNEYLIDVQEENVTPLEVEDDACQSSPTETLMVK